MSPEVGLGLLMIWLTIRVVVVRYTGTASRLAIRLEPAASVVARMISQIHLRMILTYCRSSIAVTGLARIRGNKPPSAEALAPRLWWLTSPGRFVPGARPGKF